MTSHDISSEFMLSFFLGALTNFRPRNVSALWSRQKSPV